MVVTSTGKSLSSGDFCSHNVLLMFNNQISHEIYCQHQSGTIRFEIVSTAFKSEKAVLDFELYFKLPVFSDLIWPGISSRGRVSEI